MIRMLSVALMATALIVAAPGASTVAADTQVAAGDLTKKERHQRRANRLRQESVDRAKGSLERPIINNDDPSTSTLDFHALSVQIRRLGRVISEMGEAAAEAARSMRQKSPLGGTGHVAPTVTRDNFTALYGPEGPTARSVKALLNYRLVVAGNPRLKTGRVRDDGDKITAEIVTAKEGALVERYTIDKKSGTWTPDR